MLSRQTLAEVIEPRVEELYSLVQQDCAAIGLRGTAVLGHRVHRRRFSVMQGMVELGEEIFHMPVRLGTPRNTRRAGRRGAKPALRHGMGLLLEGSRRRSAIQALQGASFNQIVSGCGMVSAMN